MSDRGIFAAGYDTSTEAYSNVIDYVTISTTGNATDFGDLTQSPVAPTSCSNAINERFVRAGGYNVTTYYNVLDYVTISTTGNATDFGDLTQARGLVGGLSNGRNERGVFGGGRINSGGTLTNTIDYITINSTGNATDFGDLLSTLSGCAGTSNATSERGLFAGASASSNVIQYITINSTGNATDLSDLSVGRGNLNACSNGTQDRGVFGGGDVSGTDSDVIDYKTISTTGNAVDFGNLQWGVSWISSMSNGFGQRGIFGGGTNGGSSLQQIQYITINSTGNAAAFGNLSVRRYGLTADSNAVSSTPKASHWQGGVSIEFMRYMYTFDRLDTTSVTITHLESGGMELPEYE